MQTQPAPAKDRVIVSSLVCQLSRVLLPHPGEQRHGQGDDKQEDGQPLPQRRGSQYAALW